MKYIEIKDELLAIVRSVDGYFLSSYQICEKLEEQYSVLWQKIKDEYPSMSKEIDMGAGTGKHYSPASFVANALAHFSKSEPKLKQEYFSCENVSFGGTIPGFTGHVLGIWAWKE